MVLLEVVNKHSMLKQLNIDCDNIDIKILKSNSFAYTIIQLVCSCVNEENLCVRFLFYSASR